MNLNINKYILSLIFTGFIFIIIPSTTYANEIPSINKYFGISQQKTVINYEKSQPSSIDNPVVDPNFNTMRSKDTCLLYTSPSPRDRQKSRMPSSA